MAKMLTIYTHPQEVERLRWLAGGRYRIFRIFPDGTCRPISELTYLDIAAVRIAKLQKANPGRTYVVGLAPKPEDIRQTRQK